MRLFKRIFGQEDLSDNYLWSIVFNYLGETKYEMLGDNVNRMIGYFMPYFAEMHLAENWVLKLRFNKTKEEINLIKQYFPDPDSLALVLEAHLARLDKSSKNSIGFKKEIFINRRSGNEIKIETLAEIQSSFNIDEMFNKMLNETTLQSNETTFFQVLDIVFVN